MGENAIDNGNNGVQFLHEQTIDQKTLYVAFRTTGTTIEPPPLTGVTEYRLSVVYYGQTTNEFDTKIYMFDETYVQMRDPDELNYYYSNNNEGYGINSLNLPITYTSRWAPSLGGGSPLNGGSTTVTSSDVGLTQNSHMFSCITLSGSPSEIISSGDWDFDIRARVNSSEGVNTLNWNVYKSQIIDQGQGYTLYSQDNFLFSGTTGTLTESYVNYNITVNYGSTIVFP